MCTNSNFAPCDSRCELYAAEFGIIAGVNTTGDAEVDVVCGKWRLEREIGRGAYGVVYLSVNGKGERAAVKVCRRDDIGDERYERELRGARLYSAIPPQ